MTAIEAREKHMIQRADYIRQEKLNFFRRSSGLTKRYNEYRWRRRKTKLNIRNHTDMFLCLYFANTIIPLSNEQLIIINKRLKFILPCHSHFYYRQPMKKIIDRKI
ncbi:unnamed protein product [Rotaria sp. Silwood2]|nr:unnamed protein product [Rotaria sp. Silwood2]CAF2799574.1 unnamed protein product [Rotaria sp. Silwood2]CAF4191245.1 unnamed protein product [Rotaria sp. Silwood2]CAF4276513.1 unnamed protein product [Rotaria sp. Silwood2]